MKVYCNYIKCNGEGIHYFGGWSRALSSVFGGGSLWCTERCLPSLAVNMLTFYHENYNYSFYDHYSFGSEFYQHRKLRDVELWHLVVLHGYVHLSSGEESKGCEHYSNTSSWLTKHCDDVLTIVRMTGVLLLVWSALQDENKSPQMEQHPVCRSTSCPISATAFLDVQNYKGPYLTVPGTTVNIGTCSCCYSLHIVRMLSESPCSVCLCVGGPSIW